MTITASSTLQNVFDANIYALTEADESNTVSLTAATDLTVGVQLAGFDLTDFYADCATAGTDVCTASTYASFDGFALVFTFTDATSAGA